MKYKYELHCHTSEGSRCAKINASQMADFYKLAGYTGIVITDHFFNGNTTVSKTLDWEDRVDLYCVGYENAKRRGDEIGLDVFFGWEFGGDFLTLGLDKKWLKNHRDLDLLKPAEYFKVIHEGGGYIIHAHPFRESLYTKSLRIFPREVDAMETINAVNTDFQNQISEYIATRYNVTKVCGTDNHVGLMEKLTALLLDKRVTDISELIDEIKNNRHEVKEYIVADTDGKVELEEYDPFAGN
ncbi:MAG: histidinol phosphatase [Clostridia bacterium]|nr:histidinol phosphatase [Clostridia bacterium]